MKLPLGSAVLDAAARLLAPFVLLFAVYVVAHGHDGPGGGFQGGVLLAGGTILVKLVRGRPGGWEVPPGLALALACVGVAIYAGIGLVPLAAGTYLDYAQPRLIDDAVTQRMLGTLGVEIGVACAVWGVVLLVFDALAAWGEDDGENAS